MPAFYTLPRNIKRANKPTDFATCGWKSSGQTDQNEQEKYAAGHIIDDFIDDNESVLQFSFSSTK
jgi:hypothetical protein